MSYWRMALHLAVWLGVFVLWLLSTRLYHPTLTVAVSATAVLVSATALAVYANSLLLLPGLASSCLWWR